MFILTIKPEEEIVLNVFKYIEAGLLSSCFAFPFPFLSKRSGSQL